MIGARMPFPSISSVNAPATFEAEVSLEEFDGTDPGLRDPSSISCASTCLLTLFRVGVGPVVFRRREPPHTPNAINLLVVVLSRVYIEAVGWKALYQRLFWNGASASV